MKKGFTLMELIATILILGIISVIAIPKIGDVIQESREKTVKASMQNYLRALEEKIMIEKIPDGTYDIKDLEVDVSGDKPTEGIVVIQQKQLTKFFISNDKYTYKNTDEGNVIIPKIKIIPTCLSCVYKWHKEIYKIGETVLEDYEEDYEVLAKDYKTFIGYIIDPDTKVIQQANICGVEHGEAYCISGLWSAEDQAKNREIVADIEEKTDCRNQEGGCELGQQINHYQNWIKAKYTTPSGEYALWFAQVWKKDGKVYISH